MSNLNTKRNSNNNNKINKPNNNLSKKNNIKSPTKRRNINNHITKSNIIKRNNKKKNKINLNIKIKNPEEKDKTDLNSIGTKNKSLSKLKYLKHLKKSFLNPMDKNSKTNSPNLKNSRTAFSNKEKNSLMNKASLSKVTTIAKRLDLVPFQNTVLS